MMESERYSTSARKWRENLSYFGEHGKDFLVSSRIWCHLECFELSLQAIFEHFLSPSTTPYYIPSEFRRHHHHRRSLLSLEIYVFSRIFHLTLETTPKHWVRLCAHRRDIDFACSTENTSCCWIFYIYTKLKAQCSDSSKALDIDAMFRWQRTCRRKKIVFSECQWLL